MFEGCATALVTPFRKDGSLDEKGLRELVDFQEDGGVDAVELPAARHLRIHAADRGLEAKRLGGLREPHAILP